MKSLLAACAFLISSVANSQSADEMIAARRLIPHVMQVRADTLGSAVALSEHLAVTNCHVLGAARNVHVLRGGLSSIAKLKAMDNGHDLCLLEVEDSPSLPVKVGSTASLAVGDKVYAVGFGLGRMSIGIGRIEALYPYDGSLIVRTDAPFAAGASGGALFDSDHNLVGVLTFFRRGVQKSSYWAMPVDWVIPLTHSDTTTIDHTQLPIWSQERAGSIRFLQVAGYEIDGDWLPMSESAKRWLAEDPQNSEAARALQFANSKLH